MVVAVGDELGLRVADGELDLVSDGLDLCILEELRETVDVEVADANVLDEAEVNQLERPKSACVLGLVMARITFSISRHVVIGLFESSTSTCGLPFSFFSGALGALPPSAFGTARWLVCGPLRARRKNSPLSATFQCIRYRSR